MSGTVGAFLGIAVSAVTLVGLIVGLFVRFLFLKIKNDLLPPMNDKLDSLGARVGSVDNRLQAIEYEMHPNGGSSMKDQVVKTAEGVQGIRDRFEDHLRMQHTDVRRSGW